MSQLNPSKIDIFCHIQPTKYGAALNKMTLDGSIMKNWLVALDKLPALSNLDLRFKVMDKYEGLMQVLTVVQPPLEAIADTKQTVDLARLANDEMAELVLKYPDRFAGAVACLPMNNMEAALVEADRVIKDLKFKGVQIFAPINGKPPDLPEFIPLYEKMAKYDLPVWIHPTRTIDYPDYKTEDSSKYRVFSLFGWPWETTVAMTRLVFSGIFDKHPNLKFITHHCGAMVPFLEQRIENVYIVEEMREKEVSTRGLAKTPTDYFKMFYNDTAVYGSTAALMCGYSFFGAEHMLFGTDSPHDRELGDRHTRKTIESIEQMSITDKEKKKIFVENAIKLLQLPFR